MAEEALSSLDPDHAPTFELLLLDAHRLAIEMTRELSFEHVSVMGLVVVQLLSRLPTALAA